MAAGSFSFGDFVLDPADRRLSRAGAPIELNSRYLDALALLLRERGRLVTKDRFMNEVWHGIPVTDEALTQCIRMLRRQLGDDAARPRFIETVPKHGYRFIADAEWSGESPVEAPAVTAAARDADWSRIALLGGAGAVGGGLAGLVGGVLYGFAVEPQPGIGAASAVLVLMAIATGIGIAGGAGVGFGIALSERVPSARWQWRAAGGMFGGLIVGALAKLLGLDAFHLLVGHAPATMTGAAEGSLLGVAVGFGAWLAQRSGHLARGLALAGAVGALAGGLIPLLGGRLLGGSLDLLARQFPEARVGVDPLGALFGETGFGPVAHTVTAAAEGGLFAVGVVGAMQFARLRIARASDRA